MEIIVEIPKSDSYANNRFRYLAFDITVFFNIIQNNLRYPRFLIHDSVFLGMDIKKLIRTLNYIYRKALKFHSFQYIFTINEDLLTRSHDDEELDFTFNLKDHTIAIFKDNPENMIFKREF